MACCKRQFGARMHFTQREMAEHEADAFTKVLAEKFHRTVSRTSAGAIKVSVLDEKNLGRIRTQGGRCGSRGMKE